MPPLHFNMHVMEFLASHRNPILTQFFLGASAFGGFDVYLIALIYVVWNKKLAVRLAVLLSLSSLLNILLKLAVGNPRPFVVEGTYLQKWAVSPETARSLAMEYSTPSGHAMGAATFYSYLFAVTRRWYVRVFAIAAILCIGASRPYLGVHYVEDVLLGWALGLGCALVAVRYGSAIGERWGRFSYSSQIGIVVAFSLAVWLLSIAVNRGSVLGQPIQILQNAGLLTGVLIGRPLELRLVDFDPQSSALPTKALRFVLTVVLASGTSLLIGKAIGAIADMPALLGFLLQYLRLVAEGFAVIFLAPLLFTRMGLAESAAVTAD
jgi:membrane-associated phospholipid phosphatase